MSTELIEAYKNNDALPFLNKAFVLSKTFSRFHIIKHTTNGFDQNHPNTTWASGVPFTNMI